jgi:F420-dependent oxidoreductase-like protein
MRIYCCSSTILFLVEEVPMRVGLVVSDFKWPGGPACLGRDLAAVAHAADEAGFASVSVMDHLFQIDRFGPPEDPMLEAYTTLGYLAGHTSRARLGVMVTAACFRHPGVLAKAVTALDVLSGGRAFLGLGAGGGSYESAALGVPFPPLAERFERLEDAVQVCLKMWSGDETPFRGHHARLERPLNSPHSLSRPHPPLLIGGMGERRTLRLAARYADACNLFPTPELPRKLEVLRAHCEAEGRDYEAIERTSMFRFDVGREGEGVDRLLGGLRWLAGMGVQTVHGAVADVHTLEPLALMGERVIPEVAGW